MKYISILLVFFLSFSSLSGQNNKNRVIILTDIEADPDDTQSIVRLLLYSNEIDIRGIVATTSCWMKTTVHPESVVKLINAYAKVQPNLLKHKPDYPESGYLLSLVKQGVPKYGMLGVGKGEDSEGSEWIIKELENKDERPLWISVWGGLIPGSALYKSSAYKNRKTEKTLISKLHEVDTNFRHQETTGRKTG
jgi:hypothetical protein